MSYQCMHVQEQYPLNSKTFKKFSPSRPFSTPPQTREQVATEFCPYFTLPTKTDSEAKNLQFNLTPFLFFLYTALFDKGHFSFLCQSVLSLSYLLLILQLFSAMIQTLKKKKRSLSAQVQHVLWHGRGSESYQLDIITLIFMLS